MACYPDVEARRCFVFSDPTDEECPQLVGNWVRCRLGKIGAYNWLLFLNCGQIVVIPVPSASTLF